MKSLKPSYKEVFANIHLLLDCLRNINVNVFAEQHVFTIIGGQIKDRLLKLIADECVMDSVQATMDDCHKSTLVQDVLRFEQTLIDKFFIHPEIGFEIFFPFYKTQSLKMYEDIVCRVSHTHGHDQHNEQLRLKIPFIK
ncbi:hypothetical protein GQX74_006125 [Glossina fuscipes]|nr:hypothetical protein GQX74_006125 [Glossina fuscipes]